MPAPSLPSSQVRSLSAANWLFLAISLVVISFLALGAHDLAIAHLGVPYPHDEATPNWARYLGQVVRIGAIVAISRKAAWFLRRRSAAGAAAIVGLVIVLLYETFRVLVINIVIVDGLVGQRWLYMVIDAMPGGVTNFLNGAAGALISRYLADGIRGRTAWRPTAAVLAWATISLFLLPPVLHASATAAEQALRVTEPSQVYDMPFNLYVYRFIYGTFVEPTLATFFIAYLIWPTLPTGPLRRIAAFAGLILLVRGRVVGTALFSFWVDQPLPLAFAAEGQFFVETLIMALLVGGAWQIVAQRRRPVHLPNYEIADN